jgi:hypothetical protein
MLAAGVFTLTSYGGIRSPDSEVVFRTAQSLAMRGSFEIPERLEYWRSFGLAPGVDGQLYSVFGPLESILLVPCVMAGEAIASGGRFDDRRVPVSTYVGDGLDAALMGVQPPSRAPHAARAPAVWFNALVSALCVLAFYHLAMTLSGHHQASLSTAALFGFATPLWFYSGTMFSEPLTMLLLVLALHRLVLTGDDSTKPPPDLNATFSGLLLGLATLSHITAILFAPFFALYLVLPLREPIGRSHRIRAVVAFLCGLGLCLAVLGFYNHARFGNPLETGRNVDQMLAARNGYGTFVIPVAGLTGLLTSPGKSVLFFIPAVLLGAAAWPAFHRRHPRLSWVLGAAVVFRFLVIASRSDWHGGYGLGPRLMLLIVPAMLLPVSVWLAGALRRDDRRRRRVFLWLLMAMVIQQLYFALGERFLFLHSRKLSPEWQGRPFDMVNDWALSPLLHSLDAGIGPFLLRGLPLAPGVLWLIGATIAALAIAAWGRRLAPADGGPRAPRESG